MCGRYTLTADPEEIRELFQTVPQALRPSLDLIDDTFTRKRWQVAPGSFVPAILPDGLRKVHWWLFPSFAKPEDAKWRTSTKGTKSFTWTSRPMKSHFNTRQDTASRKGYWNTLLDRQRCLIPATGFIEWSDDELIKAQGKEKKAGYFYMKSKKPFFFGGIFDVAKDDEGQDFTSCNIVTTDPNEMLRALPHHRMPTIILGDDAKKWMDHDLTAKDALSMIHSTPDKEMAFHFVGKIAGNARNDVPEALEPVKE